MKADYIVSQSMQHIVKHLEHVEQRRKSDCVKTCLEMLNNARPGGPDHFLFGVTEKFDEPTLHSHTIAMFAALGFGLIPSGCGSDPFWGPVGEPEFLYLMISSRNGGHAILANFDMNTGTAKVWDPAAPTVMCFPEEQFFAHYKEPFTCAFVVTYFPRNY